MPLSEMSARISGSMTPKSASAPENSERENAKELPADLVLIALISLNSSERVEIAAG
jgi:hypothetical protein